MLKVLNQELIERFWELFCLMFKLVKSPVSIADAIDPPSFSKRAKSGKALFAKEGG